MEKDRYQSNEFCMAFSTEEIERDYIDKIKAIADAAVRADYDGPGGAIDYIDFECKENSFAVRFYGFETALFVFDEKIMFVDDMQKTKYTLDHTYGNVVYDGALRNKTHREILELLLEVTKCFINCTGVAVKTEETAPSTVDAVGESRYRITVTTAEPKAEGKVFSNIEITFVGANG